MIVKYVVRLLDWTNGPRFTYQNAPSASTKKLAAHCLHRSTDGHSWHHCATHLPEKNLETTANACWHANRAPIGSHCRHEGFAFRAKMPRHYRVCTTDFVWGHDQGQKTNSFGFALKKHSIEFIKLKCSPSTLLNIIMQCYLALKLSTLKCNKAIHWKQNKTKEIEDNEGLLSTEFWDPCHRCFHCDQALHNEGLRC